MNKQRLAILITAGLGMLATFLPWAKVPIIGTVDGTAGDGWITFALYLMPLIISLTGNRNNALKVENLTGAIIPGIIAAIIGIWKITDFNSKMDDVRRHNSFGEVVTLGTSVQFGLYLVVLAGIALTIAALITRQDASTNILIEGTKDRQPDQGKSDEETISSIKSNLLNQLSQLHDLRDKNVITKEIYEQEKQNILSKFPKTPPALPNDKTNISDGSDTQSVEDVGTENLPSINLVNQFSLQSDKIVPPPLPKQYQVEQHDEAETNLKPEEIEEVISGDKESAYAKPSRKGFADWVLIILLIILIGVVVWYLISNSNSDNNSASNSKINNTDTTIADSLPKSIPDEPELIFVQGGTFNMGSNAGYRDEKPVHSVSVSSFYMSKYEVTQAQWRAVMGNNPSEHKCDNCPVENITWDDAQAYCQKQSSLTGKTYRLPTEAEWEYAARGGNKSGGFTYSGSNNIDDVAWYSVNSGNTTHPVGQKQPNELGLYDMTGNVWEWCGDWYDKDYYSSSPAQNPHGPAGRSDFVSRGGSFNLMAAAGRSTGRSSDKPDGRYRFDGFRPVVSADNNNFNNADTARVGSNNLAPSKNNEDSIAQAIDSEEWITHNHKYGFSIDLPNSFSFPQHGATASGLVNCSNTLDFDIRISVEHLQGTEASLAIDYQTNINTLKGIDYKTLQKTWYVISGQDEDGTYYRKTFLKNGWLYYLTVIYPPSYNDLFDRILPRIAKSFQ